MKGTKKTREQLIEELLVLQKRSATLDASGGSLQET